MGELDFISKLCRLDIYTPLVGPDRLSGSGIDGYFPIEAYLFGLKILHVALKLLRTASQYYHAD